MPEERRSRRYATSRLAQGHCRIRSREWGEGELVDSDQYEELKEDLAAAQEAMEEYEAKGIKGTIPYSQYRSKRLGPQS